jgi:FtsZ-interacting cell division protein ZipA
MEIFGITIPDTWVLLIIVLIGVVLIIVIGVWVMHKSRGSARKMEIEVEKQKLDLLAKDIDARAKEHPFTRLSPEQVQQVRAVEEENELLELNNYHKEKIVEARLRKLENLVRGSKLGQMLVKLDLEEDKVK